MSNTILLSLLLFVVNLIILNKATVIGSFFRLIDHPIINRSIHVKPTPKIGGLLIFVNILVINLFFNFIIKTEYLNDINQLILSVSIIFFTIGYLDDVINLSPLKRLLLIIFGMLVLNLINDKIILNFLYFETINKTIYLNNYNYLFTFFCIYLLLNTFNMTDGINGLALNIFIIWFLYLIFYSKNLSVDVMFYFIPSILILLFFNFKNKVFIGNSGSYLLGGLISILTIYSYNLEYLKSSDLKLLYVENIFLLFLVPGLDCARLFFYRILVLKKNFYHADNNHFHHLLLNRFSFSKTLVIYIALIIVPIFLNILFREYILLVILFNILTYVFLILKCTTINK